MCTSFPVPIGGVIPFAGSTAPEGWLLCDGAWVSETDYAALYSVIGDAYDWSNEKSSHVGQFKLPDLRGRFVEGKTANGTLGGKVEAGLPNVTGRASPLTAMSAAGYEGVPFYGAGEGALTNPGSLTTRRYYQSAGTTTLQFHTGLAYDASLSNSIYGSSTTVQPPSVLLNQIIFAGI